MSEARLAEPQNLTTLVVSYSAVIHPDRQDRLLQRIKLLLLLS
jgi:hypothetical protein